LTPHGLFHALPPVVFHTAISNARVPNTIVRSQ
jgi:hypothetical protein